MSTFVITVLNSLSGKSFPFLRDFSPWGFTLFFCLFIPLSSHSVSLSLDVSMKLCIRVTRLSIEGISLCGSFPIQSACPSVLGGRAGSDMSTGHIFFQDALAARALVGGRAGIGGSGTRPRCNQAFYAHWQLLPYQEMRLHLGGLK